jgi:nucleoside-diphosphate-sugar epimerase
MSAPAVIERLSDGRAPKKILILGGTGFIGPHVVDAARARGHTVTLFNRGTTHPKLFPDTEKLRGDRDGKLGALKDRAWDAVVDRAVPQSALRTSFSGENAKASRDDVAFASGRTAPCFFQEALN